MSEILIEVRPATYPSGDLKPRQANPPEDFERRAPELMHAVLVIADQLRAQLDSSTAPPPPPASAKVGKWTLDEVTTTFGLELQAEAGVIFAKVGGAATLTVELKWTRGDA